MLSLSLASAKAEARRAAKAKSLEENIVGSVGQRKRKGEILTADHSAGPPALLKPLQSGPFHWLLLGLVTAGRGES